MPQIKLKKKKIINITNIDNHSLKLGLEIAKDIIIKKLLDIQNIKNTKTIRFKDIPKIIINLDLHDYITPEFITQLQSNNLNFISNYNDLKITNNINSTTDIISKTNEQQTIIETSTANINNKTITHTNSNIITSIDETEFSEFDKLNKSDNTKKYNDNDYYNQDIYANKKIKKIRKKKLKIINISTKNDDKKNIDNINILENNENIDIENGNSETNANLEENNIDQNIATKITNKKDKKKENIEENLELSKNNKENKISKIIENNIIKKKNEKKRGRKRKNIIDKLYYDDNYVALWEEICNGERILIDSQNNAFTFDMEKPKYLGKLILEGKIDNTKPYTTPITIKYTPTS